MIISRTSKLLRFKEARCVLNFFLDDLSMALQLTLICKRTILWCSLGFCLRTATRITRKGYNRSSGEGAQTAQECCVERTFVSWHYTEVNNRGNAQLGCLFLVFSWSILCVLLSPCFHSHNNTWKKLTRWRESFWLLHFHATNIIYIISCKIIADLLFVYNYYN